MNFGVVCCYAPSFVDLHITMFPPFLLLFTQLIFSSSLYFPLTSFNHGDGRENELHVSLVCVASDDVTF